MLLILSVLIKIIKDKNSLKTEVDLLRSNQQSIGFVPTMGALHEGHISLINKCLSENDMCIASIFVNPTQFNDPNDFDRYPRIIDKDLEKLDEAGCQIVYVPDVEDIYPNRNFELIKIDLGIIENQLEGKYRPGHFDGVVTIVKKLFDIVNPHKAYFGQKDFQQYLVIKKMTEIFNLDIEIIRCPILREHDGLAMSSRNMLLNEKERQLAPMIYQCLQKSKEMLDSKTIEEVKEWAKKELIKHDLVELDYFEICDTINLLPLNSLNNAENAVICTALKIGKIRLIDNILLN